MFRLNDEFKVLSRRELLRVHELSLELLWKKGVWFYSEPACEIFSAHGALVEGSRVRIPPLLLERCLANCPAGFTWQARDEAKSLRVGEGQSGLYVMQNHGPVFVQERDGTRRLGTLEDVANFYKLGQSSAVNSIVGQVSVDPHELTDSRKHLKITRQLLKHTDKPIVSYPVAGLRETYDIFEMVEMVMGSGYLADHYFLTASVCALSPYRYARESAETIIAYARRNQPVTLLTAPMRGISAPMGGIASLLAQNMEVLAGLALAQLERPGVPVIYGTGLFTVDMKTGNCLTASPDANLVDRASIQLAKELYRLPTRFMAGDTDAKLPDIQAGYETMQNYLLPVMGGADMINECLGILDGMLAVSYEKYIVDEELLRRFDCMMRGLDTREEAFDLSALLETEPEETFLTHPSTLEACAAQWEPDVACWSSYDVWEQAGRPSALDVAARKCAERLAAAPQSLLEPALDAALARFAE